MPMIPLAQIEPDPENVRLRPTTTEADNQLAASMTALGLLQPIVLRAEGAAAYRVIAGHRRYEAARKIGWTEIPAVILDPESQGQARLMQLSENAVRADMSAVDLWCAVEKAASEGQPDEAISLAMNLPLRRVAQLRAMGSLPAPLCEFIRAHDEVPPEDVLRVICQAPAERVLAAFKEAKGRWRKTDYRFPWWNVKDACSVSRIPLSEARFDLDLYDGPVFRDLFAEQEQAEALDTARFLELQREWAKAQPEAWKAKGFARAECLPVSSYGELDLPPGFRRAEALPATARIKKADRASHAYFLGVKANGQVVEMVCPVPAPKRQEQDQALRDELASHEPPPKPERGPITKAGIEDMHRTKRGLVENHLKEGVTGTGDLLTMAEMLAITLALLDDRSGWSGPKLDNILYNEDTSITFDASRLRTAFQTLASWHVRPKTGVSSLGVTEIIGHGLGISPSWTLNRDGLDWLNKDGLQRVRQALGVPDFNTAKQLKAELLLRKGAGGSALTLTPDHLSEIEWQLTAPAKAPGYDDADDLDEDDGDALASAGLGTDEDYRGDHDGMEDAA